MITHKEALEIIANNIILESAENVVRKPNYSNRDFMNTLLIFQTALMDKMYDNQDFDKMPMEDRMKMAESCGEEIRKLIFTYTGLDTHKAELFL